jgi:hypothetical protein
MQKPVKASTQTDEAISQLHVALQLFCEPSMQFINQLHTMSKGPETVPDASFPAGGRRATAFLAVIGQGIVKGSPAVSAERLDRRDAPPTYLPETDVVIMDHVLPICGGGRRSYLVLFRASESLIWQLCATW